VSDLPYPATVFQGFIKKHFGRLIYMVSVVEFQKQGLPHCHLLIKAVALQASNVNDSVSDFFCFFRSSLSCPWNHLTASCQQNFQMNMRTPSFIE
jgi:hypothetical protein